MMLVVKIRLLPAAGEGSEGQRKSDNGKSQPCDKAFWQKPGETTKKDLGGQQALGS